MLIGGVPELPYSVTEGTLSGEVVPLSIHNLIRFVLNAERGVWILQVFVDDQDEMRGAGVGSQTLPPQGVPPRGALSE